MRKILLKKLILSALAGLILLFSLAPYFPARAQSTWYNTDFKTFTEKVYDEGNPSEIFGERYTAAQVQWIIYSLFAFMIKNGSSGGDFMLCALSNSDIITCKDKLESLLKQLEDTKKQQENQGYYQNLEKESLASLIFNTRRSLSGFSYIRERLNRFHLVPEVQAQTVGFGFDALKPIQAFWKATRDVSYSLFVLVAIVFAFLVMFRVKLSPQTVITVQSALPKIILVLIAATFSYAIAGFLVDFMYVVIGLISLIFGKFLTLSIGNFGINPKFYFSLMTTGPLNSGIFGTLAAMGFFFFLPLILILVVGGLIAGLLSLGAGWIIALIVILIVIIIYLWIAIKTIWMLLKTFAHLLLNIIFSPLQLTLGVLVPNFSLGSWIKSVVSQLSVFVTVGVLSILSFIFGVYSLVLATETFAQNWWKDIIIAILNLFFFGFGGTLFNLFTGWSNSWGTPGWPPLLGTGGGYAIAFLMWAVAFVLFTLIPKASDIIKAVIEGKPFAYGTAIGEAMAPVKGIWGMTGAPMLRSYQELQTKDMITQFARTLREQPDRYRWMPTALRTRIQRIGQPL